MARRSLEISRTAERQIKKLGADDQRRVVDAILKLADDPHPPGSRKLAGLDDVFRVRVGRFRILYSLSIEGLVVIILKVGHRKDVYR